MLHVLMAAIATLVLTFLTVGSSNQHLNRTTGTWNTCGQALTLWKHLWAGGDSWALSSRASAGFVRAETCLEKLLSRQSRRKGFPKGPFRTGADKDPEGDFTPLSIDHRQPRETRPNIDMSAVSQGYAIRILVLRRKWIFLNSA